MKNGILLIWKSNGWFKSRTVKKVKVTNKNVLYMKNKYKRLGWKVGIVIWV